MSNISSFHVWLVPNLYILLLVFGFLKEEEDLEKCTCRYLCSIGILYVSHSMHYNYPLLNFSLYVGMIYT